VVNSPSSNCGIVDASVCGIVYDAAAVQRILDLPCACNDPVPKAGDGEIVIYYGGWELQTLRNCTAGKTRMWQDQNWYDAKGWKAEPGYYRVLFPVPRSNRMTWSEQLNHLKAIDGVWQPATVAIAATATLIHLTETGNYLLSKDDWCRCEEGFSGGSRLVFGYYRGRVRIHKGRWDGKRYDHVWLVGCRKS
jgi:hypothetical protein